jgi:hypothetical protein
VLAFGVLRLCFPSPSDLTLLYVSVNCCSRNYEAQCNDKNLAVSQRKCTYTIDKQFVKLLHPQNSDSGEVEMDIELLPLDVATQPKYKAGAGEDGWSIMTNSSTRVLPTPIRPPSSFPWYRLDLQCLWRVSYCWKKTRWYVFRSFECLFAHLFLYASQVCAAHSAAGYWPDCGGGVRPKEHVIFTRTIH